MTKFEPEVAYRILHERYERLIAEKAAAYYYFFVATVDGHWYDDIFYSLDRIVKLYEQEIDDLWPVLDYLSQRIEEEKNDAVS